ncbi:MAG: flagellar export chaperone FliS [Pirellulales bacterium]
MSARLAYLETQVLTASPPKLRHLLIQVALRTAQKSLQHWTNPLTEETSQALTQLRQVLIQLLTSLNEGEDEPKCNLQRVYLYLFQTVTQAQLSGNIEKIRDVVKVLEVENNTWRVLADRYAHRKVDDQTFQPTNDCPKSSPKSSPCMGYAQDHKTVTPSEGLCLVA